MDTATSTRQVPRVAMWARRLSCRANGPGIHLLFNVFGIWIADIELTVANKLPCGVDGAAMYNQLLVNAGDGPRW